MVPGEEQDSPTNAFVLRLPVATARAISETPHGKVLYFLLKQTLPGNTLRRKIWALDRLSSENVTDVVPGPAAGALNKNIVPAAENAGGSKIACTKSKTTTSARSYFLPDWKPIELFHRSLMVAQIPPATDKVETRPFHDTDELTGCLYDLLMDEVDGSDCAGCRSVDDVGEDHKAGGDGTNSGAFSLLEALMRVFRRYLEMHNEVRFGITAERIALLCGERLRHGATAPVAAALLENLVAYFQRCPFLSLRRPVASSSGECSTSFQLLHLEAVFEKLLLSEKYLRDPCLAQGGAGQSQAANPSSGAVGKAIVAAIALLKHLRFDSEESCLRALRLFFRWPRKLLAGQAIAAEDVVRRELSQLENGGGGPRADNDLNIPAPPPGPKRRKLSTTKVEGEDKDVDKSLKEKEKDAKKQLQEQRRIRFNQATAYVNRFVEGMISAVETNIASNSRRWYKLILDHPEFGPSLSCLCEDDRPQANGACASAAVLSKVPPQMEAGLAKKIFEAMKATGGAGNGNGGGGGPPRSYSDLLTKRTLNLLLACGEKQHALATRQEQEEDVGNWFLFRQSAQEILT